MKNETREALQGWAGDWDKTKAKGVWPDVGTHVCKVTGLTVGTLPFRWRVPDPNDKRETLQRGECEGVSFQFSYQLQDDPNNPENPMQFDGNIVVVPVDSSSIPDGATGSQTKAKIDSEKIKTALVTLMEGTVAANPLEAAEYIQGMISRGDLVAKVRVSSREWNGDTQYEDKITFLVASPDH
jgi:hypothetical protein